MRLEPPKCKVNLKPFVLFDPSSYTLNLGLPAYDGHAEEDVEGAEDELYVDEASHTLLIVILRRNF
jgi:hypothetical protein